MAAWGRFIAWLLPVFAILLWAVVFSARYVGEERTGAIAVLTGTYSVQLFHDVPRLELPSNLDRSSFDRALLMAVDESLAEEREVVPNGDMKDCAALGCRIPDLLEIRDPQNRDRVYRAYRYRVEARWEQALKDVESEVRLSFLPTAIFILISTLAFALVVTWRVGEPDVRTLSPPRSLAISLIGAFSWLVGYANTINVRSPNDVLEIPHLQIVIPVYRDVVVFDARIDGREQRFALPPDLSEAVFERRLVDVAATSSQRRELAVTEFGESFASYGRANAERRWRRSMEELRWYLGFLVPPLLLGFAVTLVARRIRKIAVTT